MNPFKTLESILSRLEATHVITDPGESPSTSWWMEARLNDKLAIVEWNYSFGFGVSDGPGEGFNDPPDIIVETESEALIEILRILNSKSLLRPNQNDPSTKGPV